MCANKGDNPRNPVDITDLPSFSFNRIYSVLSPMPGFNPELSCGCLFFNFMTFRILDGGGDGILGTYR